MKQKIFGSLRNYFVWLFQEDRPDEVIYDPLHVGGVILGTLFALGCLYWLLWALLVYAGGLFTKIIPFLRVLFTVKTLRDFGYEGYPYKMGVFEGWYVNLAAWGIFLAVVYMLWRAYGNVLARRGSDEKKS